MPLVKCQKTVSHGKEPSNIPQTLWSTGMLASVLLQRARIPGSLPQSREQAQCLPAVFPIHLPTLCPSALQGTPVPLALLLVQDQQTC